LFCWRLAFRHILFAAHPGWSGNTFDRTSGRCAVTIPNSNPKERNRGT
jgi:hypothetical protein